MRTTSRSGLTVEINGNGSLRRIDYRDITINLFPGNEIEGGPANLYLRLRDGRATRFAPLLGPCSPARFAIDAQRFAADGTWNGVRFAVALDLADAAPAWFWRVTLENTTAVAQTVDLVYVQDIALAPYAAIRLNEFYVSHYVDHAPLSHADAGWVVASRQNLAVAARTPWAMIGSLRRAVAFATDAIQVHGLATRAGAAPIGLIEALPSVRQQHEHSLVALQDAPLTLAPGEQASAGFFGWIEADHPAATSERDLEIVDRARALLKARRAAQDAAPAGRAATATLFAPAPLLQALDLAEPEIELRFGARRHEERDDDGRLLSFFCGADRHVALRAKELRVLRPHGHMLHTGRAPAVDETALTSTAWMAGVFHSMLTQGHVGINRLLSTTRSYLGLYRSHGLRVFVEVDGAWQLLDVPSAFEMAPDECRWVYRHAAGTLEVRSSARGDSHELGLRVDVIEGAAARLLVCLHVALDGDDGGAAGPVRFTVDGSRILVTPSPDSELGRRFPTGSFRIEAGSGAQFERIGGDELLFADGASRSMPFLCIVTAPTKAIDLRVRGSLVTGGADVPGAGDAPSMAWRADALPQLHAPALRAVEAARLNDIVPWYAHNAMIHFLAPRGLEQYSGGGWGTRDVCQGPVELLLALGQTVPVRELLLRVFSAQNPDGDWPQWFTFFARERAIRAGDSHGDIAFWPLLALAQYLLACEDAALLDEQVPFFHPDGDARAEHATVWQHAERALALIGARTIAGTSMAAYGHGDWNDTLQPADPSLRERMCSAWTVTLHVQVLNSLATAMQRVRRHDAAAEFDRKAASVRRDFQRLLMPDGVIAGYALFDGDNRIDYLLHPRDRATGVRYSLLPMIHAIINDLLSPAQAREHLALIAAHLAGPDGARLFDRPLAYRGGPQRFFQRAESSAFFGREVGLMYMHAHLRYAEALAHVGEADRFFEALGQASPIGLQTLVPAAALRQANCYYSSSDAAFRDRYQAEAEYDRVARGDIELNGGWRIYSSGPGIAVSLILRSFLGIRREKSIVAFDPVMPSALDGLRAGIELEGRKVALDYRVGAAGCGPIAVVLNGAALPFARGTNPYRVGAAEVSMASLLERLTGDGDTITVEVG